MLDYAQCMRDHGIDMPDPQFSADGTGGRLTIQQEPTGSDVPGPQPGDAVVRRGRVGVPTADGGGAGRRHRRSRAAGGDARADARLRRVHARARRRRARPGVLRQRDGHDAGRRARRRTAGRGRVHRRQRGLLATARSGWRWADPRPPRADVARDRRRVATLGIVVLALGVGAGGVAYGVSQSTTPASPDDPDDAAAPNTVAIGRQDIVRNDEFDGTLGYGTATPLVLAGSGTLTRLPARRPARSSPATPSSTSTGARCITALGDVPMWRDLGPGVDDGADVAEVEHMLDRLGYATDYDVTVDEEWTSATTRAVKAFQADHGQDDDGTIASASCWSCPAPVRVDTVGGVPGMAVAEAAIEVDRRRAARPGRRRRRRGRRASPSATRVTIELPRTTPPSPARSPRSSAAATAGDGTYHGAGRSRRRRADRPAGRHARHGAGRRGVGRRACSPCPSRRCSPSPRAATPSRWPTARRRTTSRVDARRLRRRLGRDRRRRRRGPEVVVP